MKPGEVIGERFEIALQAGAGGMGVVYRARDLRTGAPVAIKVLIGYRLVQHARFAREAEVLAALDHPAVVHYVAHGATPGGEAFLAMEWLEGEPLSARLARGPLSLHETWTVALRLADALAAAHRAGVVHRDVKPTNVMLVGGDVARATLVDFGVARVVDRTLLTATGAMVGTLGYMAPEQARGESVIDARADVFALGAVMFRCLAGRPPFDGGEPLTLLVRLINEDSPRLSSLLPGVPPAVDDLLARMLSRTLAERPPDCAAVLDELRRQNQLAPGPPPSASVRVTAPPPPPPTTTPLPPSTTVPATAPPPPPSTSVRATAPPPLTEAAALELPPGFASSRRNLYLVFAGVVLVVAVTALASRVVGPRFPRVFRECVWERCEHVELPNAVEASQLLARMRSIVLGVDRSAALVVFATGPSVRNGLVDTTRGQATAFFRIPSAPPGRNTIMATLMQGRVEMRWMESAYELRNLPEPRCAGPKLAAVARTHGVSSDGATSYTYAWIGGTPGWTVSVTQPKPAVVMLREPACEP